MSGDADQRMLGHVRIVDFQFRGTSKMNMTNKYKQIGYVIQDQQSMHIDIHRHKLVLMYFYIYAHTHTYIYIYALHCTTFPIHNTLCISSEVL